MTFFASDEKIWGKLFDTNDVLQPGGRFIGAVMDGHRVHDLLESERRWKSLSYENLEKKYQEMQSQVRDMTDQENIDKISKLNKRIKNIQLSIRDIEQERMERDYQSNKKQK